MMTRLQSSGTVACAVLEGNGEFISGTGRFEGIRGTFSMKGQGGLSAAAPGVLADVFGDLKGDYTLPAR